MIDMDIENRESVFDLAFFQASFFCSFLNSSCLKKSQLA
jgi:hypothetical protein